MGCIRLSILDEQYKSCEQKMFAVKSSLTFYKSENNLLRDYLYGWNTQERTDEIAGAGNHYTAQFWEYDSRIGRRWELDPVPQIAISDYAVNRNNPIYYNDPDGDCPNCVTAAIGAGVGALIGGAIEIGSQLYNNGSVTNWKAVGGSALQGGITGGAAGFTGGASLLVTAGTAGAANAVGGAINNKIQGKPVTVLSVVTDASIGLAFGVAGKYVSKLVNFKSGGKIVTSGVTHGTEQHWATMTGLAKNLAQKGETVYLNKSINTALGKTIEGVGNWRPDVVSIGKNGVVNLTEVISPSQTAKEIWSKMTTMATALEKQGYKVTRSVLSESGKAVKQP
jgi:hypothetical protein